MKQWHPLFARLLRPLVEDHYDIRINLPVGDLPREADIVLLRRTSQGPLPFRGLWRHLTPWSILEFKGPTVSPRRRDLDWLVEVGLGIDRRLNQERLRQRRVLLRPTDVSFWYIANHLGSRFLRNTERSLGALECLGAGLWRCRLLERLVYLLSRRDLPVDEESVPLHLVADESAATELAVGRLVAEQPRLWDRYSAWLKILHPSAWKEIQIMRRTLGRSPAVDFRVLADEFGLENLINQIGLKRMIDEVGLKRVIDDIGLKRVINEVGLQRVIDDVGLKRMIHEVDAESLVSSLSAEQRREIKRLLK